MAQKRWIVLIDWVDGIVTDTDEVSVFATSASSAIKKAEAIWKDTNSKRWPNCRIEGSSILTPEIEKSYC